MEILGQPYIKELLEKAKHGNRFALRKLFDYGMFDDVMLAYIHETWLTAKGISFVDYMDALEEAITKYRADEIVDKYPMRELDDKYWQERDNGE